MQIAFDTQLITALVIYYYLLNFTIRKSNNINHTGFFCHFLFCVTIFVHILYIYLVVKI